MYIYWELGVELLIKMKSENSRIVVTSGRSKVERSDKKSRLMTKSENAVRARRDSRVEVMSNVLIDVKGGVVCILLVAKRYERYSKVSEGLVYATVYSIVNRPTPPSPPPPLPSLFSEKEGDRHTTLQGHNQPETSSSLLGLGLCFPALGISWLHAWQ